ncbi:MAG: transposase [Candidatus Sumerlaeota bacterium]
MHEGIKITERNLPHWTKEDSIYWITFRLGDSVPQSKIAVWRDERRRWVDAHPKPWSKEVWLEYHREFELRIDKWLDRGFGSQSLAHPHVREALKTCMLRFEGERLNIHCAVIMPTHVHVLLEPLKGYQLSALLKGMKGAGAREANRILRRTGPFWEEESYDHIVRNREQYLYFCDYIANNPSKACLGEGAYWFLPRPMDKDFPLDT